MNIDWSLVTQAIKTAEAHGTVGVSVIAPDDTRWEYNGTRRFRAASTVKVPVMIEIYRRVECGKLSLQELHSLEPTEKAEGSGVLLHLHDGLEVTIADLLYLMMSISDNTATNILIRKVGFDAVNFMMRELDMRDSGLAREMKGRAARDDELENWATPRDYATVIRAILEKTAASPESCHAMIAVLEKQQNPRRIARHLPEDKRVRWGSKTGGLKGNMQVTNDVGFIEGPGGRLILAVFCEGMPDQHEGELAIGAISRAACSATGILHGSVAR
jgi:beta-lactamase class A